MIDRLMICAELCRHAHVKRRNPTRTSLTKKELIAVWRHVVQLETKTDQLTAALAVYSSGNAPHVKATDI